jgi:TPR repeat protein
MGNDSSHSPYVHPEQEGLDAAYQLFSEGKYSQALPKLAGLEEREIYEASLYLGYMHQRGWGVDKDADQALNHYLKSADSGSAIGAYYAGTLLEKLGKVEDCAKYHTLAARKGQITSAYALFRLGNSGAANVPESEAFLEQAVRGGHFFASEILIRMFRGRYGFVGRLKAIPMTFVALYRGAWLLANDPRSDKFH